MGRIKQEKGTQPTWFSVQSVNITFILFKRHRCIDISIFILLSCRGKAHDNKEFNGENSKPRRESRITTR